MAVVLPETTYDADVNYHWQNANDRVAYQRSFDTAQITGDRTQARIAQAMLVANPQTTNLEIQMNMNQSGPAPRFGQENIPPTIENVLNNDYESPENTRLWNDFSDSNGEYSGTAVPSIPNW